MFNLIEDLMTQVNIIIMNYYYILKFYSILFPVNVAWLIIE